MARVWAATERDLDLWRHPSLPQIGILVTDGGEGDPNVRNSTTAFVSVDLPGRFGRSHEPARCAKEKKVAGRKEFPATLSCLFGTGACLATREVRKER